MKADKAEKPYKLILFTLTLFISILIPLDAKPHPGGTDSKGCHTCRTNCERWGIPQGFYHRHNPVRDCFEKKKPSPTPSPQNSSTKYTENEFRTVIRVVDGDTIILNGGERVRLIGVDTPETVHPNKPVEYFGKEASVFIKNMVEGKQVRLEFDTQLKDKYGRTLAYVYLPDGSMINALLVKEGYAQVMTIPPNVKYADLFLALQREAREHRKGLWGN